MDSSDTNTRLDPSEEAELKKQIQKTIQLMRQRSKNNQSRKYIYLHRDSEQGIIDYSKKLAQDEDSQSHKSFASRASGSFSQISRSTNSMFSATSTQVFQPVKEATNLCREPLNDSDQDQSQIEISDSDDAITLRSPPSNESSLGERLCSYKSSRQGSDCSDYSSSLSSPLTSMTSSQRKSSGGTYTSTSSPEIECQIHEAADQHQASSNFAFESVADSGNGEGGDATDFCRNMTNNTNYISDLEDYDEGSQFWALPDGKPRLRNHRRAQARAKDRQILRMAGLTRLSSIQAQRSKAPESETEVNVPTYDSPMAPPAQSKLNGLIIALQKGALTLRRMMPGLRSDKSSRREEEGKSSIVVKAVYLMICFLFGQFVVDQMFMKTGPIHEIRTTRPFQPLLTPQVRNLEAAPAPHSLPAINDPPRQPRTKSRQLETEDMKNLINLQDGQKNKTQAEMMAKDEAEEAEAIAELLPVPEGVFENSDELPPVDHDETIILVEGPEKAHYEECQIIFGASAFTVDSRMNYCALSEINPATMCCPEPKDKEAKVKEKKKAVEEGCEDNDLTGKRCCLSLNACVLDCLATPSLKPNFEMCYREQCRTSGKDIVDNRYYAVGKSPFKFCHKKQ